MNGAVFNLGFGELAVVLVVALLFLGPKMLPEIATGLGKVIREIRKTTADIRQDIELDDVIRGPLRELRDAATLPPEELKRRDEAKEARRKAEAEAEARRQHEAKEAAEAQRKQREQEAATSALPTVASAPPTVASAPPTVVEPPQPAEVITTGGTMIATPPPIDDLRTLTPVPEMPSPAPTVTAPPPRLPKPPLPPPKTTPPQEATVFDLQAQLRAAADAKSTLAGRPVLAPQQSRPIPPRPPEGKKG